MTIKTLGMGDISDKAKKFFKKKKIFKNPPYRPSKETIDKIYKFKRGGKV